MNNILHFAHGNGFPSSCYRQMLQHLAVHFKCVYVDRVGHSTQFPVTDNWQHLVSEIVHSVQTKATKPVIGVGHSLGGILSLLAAIQQPALFRAVILLDSPLLGRVKSNFLRVSKILGLVDRITPALRTKRRRDQWDTKEEAISYLKQRDLFKYFDDACLMDYVEFGMQKGENGYRLRFDRHIEYQIYRTIPHNLHEYEGKLHVPAALIYGNQSDVVDRLDLRNMKKNYGVNLYRMDGTHMFPMEHPKVAAALICKVIDKLTAA